MSNGSIVNFSTTNAQVTDEIINVPNSNPVNLQHYVFYNKTGKKVSISTAPAGGGTVLTETTDWVAGDAFPDANFPTSISPDVGYTSIAIVNATYHSTDLYVNYYPIMDVWQSSLWNTSLDLPSLGDFDISTSNQTASVKQVLSYSAGYRFRVSWHSGDGSNTFSLTDISGVTIDGIAASNYTGEGTGHLDLKVVSSTELETINAGEVWDSDGGGFADRTFVKYTTGKMRQTASVDKNNGLTTGQSFSHAVTFASVDEGDVQQDSASNTSMSQFDNLVSSYTAAFNVVIIAIGAGSAVTVTRHCTASFDGRWTTSHPRKS